MFFDFLGRFILFLDILHFPSLFVKNLPNEPAVFGYCTEDLRREGIEPRICEKRVSYRGQRDIPRTEKRKDKSYKENENTEVDITDTKREQETSKKRSETEL